MLPKLIDFAPESAIDDDIRALLEALDFQLERLEKESICVVHLPRLDELSGKILDILADQLHCDFYNSLTFDEETKRQVIRDSINWHRHKGTPYAVEKVSADFKQRCDLAEWFEYGDEPAWFRINTDPFYIREDLDGWLRAVLIAKNVRSWCRLRFEHDEHGELYFGIADFIGGTTSITYAPPDTSSHFELSAGIQTFINGNIGVGIAVDNHEDTANLFAGVHTYIRGTISVGIARPDNETLAICAGVTSFIHGSISVGIVKEIPPLFFSGDWLTLHFNFPSNVRQITLQNPRKDLTRQEIKDVGEFVAEKDLLTNSEGESTSGIIRADLITKDDYIIF